MSPTVHRFGAFVQAVRGLRGGRLAFALGDGTVRLVDPSRPDAVRTVEAHGNGACLALAPDLDGDALLSGGDDGRLVRVPPEGEPEPLAAWPGKWVNAVDAHAKPRLRAVAAGKLVHLLDREARSVQILEHPSTASGVAFDPSGQRLAVAHYGGVTLWVGYRDGWRPSLLPWKGSHLDVAWSPSGKFIVSTMQEGALHGWRLGDRKDMRMTGYPAKVRSLSWAARGRWLATSGAEAAVLWPYRGEDGPMGKEPLMLAPGNAPVTAVAAHSAQPLVALGRKDGTVELARIEDGEAVRLRPADGDPVSAIAWASDGRTLAAGTEEGTAALLALGRG